MESGANKEILSPSGRELTPAEIRHPTDTESGDGFLPELSWSHYRALMRVEDGAARAFYEREASADSQRVTLTGKVISAQIGL